MSPPTMSLTPTQVLEARRRKVRKGTHSCWECRRRKIRCQYTSPDDVICIGCRARGSACRSQELADEAPPPQQMPEKKVAQRLDRLENMMEQLMTHVMAAPAPSASDDGAAAPNRKSAAGGRHGSSSAAASDADGTSPSGRILAERACGEYEETGFEHIDKVYHDPTDIVAHVCPTAAGHQGYGVLDVLDTSTADDTPVAALLGIQTSLSSGGSAPNNAASTAAAGATSIPVLSATAADTVTSTAGAGLSPGSMDTSVNGANSPANSGSTSTNGSTGGGQDTRGPGIGSTSGSSDTASTTATAATIATSMYGRPSDPVTKELTRQQHLSRLLHSLFPAQEDIDTIASGAPTQYIITLFHTKHDISAGRSESPSKLREVPPMTSHPTVLARRLLQLTLCMQQLAPSFVLQNKLYLVESLSDVINRIAGIVSHTVTSNDELIGSVEGLECLILLGQQQSNAGQLRKAWLSYRRAMSLAQLMGLDRGNTRALKSCDTTSDPRTRPTPAAMWYRINSCDRYVSLLLGLRAGSQDDDGYTDTNAKPVNRETNGDSSSSFEDDTDTPVEKLEKAHTVLTGRIIERNHGKISLDQSFAETQAIDADLRAAASRNLNPTWWEVPSYDPYARPDFIFSEIARSILQVHHHCIMILLHLPYMLRGEHPAAAAAKMMAATSSAGTGMCERLRADGDCEGDDNAGSTGGTPRAAGQKLLSEKHGCSSGLAYSKATCLQSSRAVLQRFTHFRLLVNTSFSCRHVDYASLIAAMTLIIGYLGPRPAPGSDVNVLDAFDHQLRQDRAMVEQVRERMEHIGKANNDRLSRESAATIQQLMPILDLVAKKPEPASAGGKAAAAAGTGGYTSPGRSNTNSGPVASSSPAGSSSLQKNGHYGQGNSSNCMQDDTTSPARGGSAFASHGTTAASAVRLNVPYFGTVNIHTNAATGMSSMSPHYQHSPQTSHQQQQQQQLHQDLSSAGFSPATVPVSYDLFTSPTASRSALDWSGNTPQQHPQQQHHQQQQQQQDAADLNAMLVDFDPPMQMTDDGNTGGVDGGGSAHNGGNGGGENIFDFADSCAFPDMTGACDDWVMQGVDTTYWSLLNGGGGSFGGQMG